jgi:hypothetical protein
MKAEKWRLLSEKFASQQHKNADPDNLDKKQKKKLSEGRSLMEGITMDSLGNLMQ